MARKYEAYRETEQEIKIQAQKQQIDKLTLRIGQLEEQYKNKEKHMMGEIQRLLHIEELSRGLCQKILDKDRREIVLGDKHSWSAMSSEQMIEAAQKSYKTYCEKRTKDMQKIGNYANDLREKYEALVEKNNELNKTLEEYESSGMGVSSGREKQIRSRINDKVIVDGKEVGKGTVVTEPDDDDEEEVTVQTVAKKPSKPAEKSQRTTDSISTADREMENEVRLLVESMIDSEKNILKLIGDGMSVSAEVRSAVSKQMAESTAHRCLKSLSGEGYIEGFENINFPGTKNCTLFRLTRKGKAAYRLITGSAPNEPEMDRILKAHSTLEHGYGIRACQRIIERSGRYESVNMFPEKIKVPDGTQGYIPDLKCTRVDENGNKVVEYFEYERLKQKDVIYYAKFGKMSMVTNEINVIVANPTEQEKAQRLLAAWANSKKTITGYPNKIIRLTNYNKIRDCVEKGKPFTDWWYMTDRLSDFKPPLGYEGPLGDGV